MGAAKGRFIWHELLTTDYRAAADFYTKVVGWTTGLPDGADVYHVLWLANGMVIGGLMDLPPQARAMGAPPSWLAYVEVPDVDAAVELAVAAGGQLVVPTRTVPDVARFAVITDPDGAVIGLMTNLVPVLDEVEPKPLEFAWHELMTADCAAAQSFYAKLFGWTVKREFNMGEAGVYHVFGGERFTYGGMYTVPPGQRPFWLHYVRVSNADEAVARATRLGGRVINGPMDVPGGGRVAALADPQGAMFAVMSEAVVPAQR